MWRFRFFYPQVVFLSPQTFNDPSCEAAKELRYERSFGDGRH